MQYYNHLTDKMEELEPAYMALNLPKSKEEYERRERIRTIENKMPIELLNKLNREYPMKPSECFKTEGDEIVEPEVKYTLLDLSKDTIKDLSGKGRDLKKPSYEEVGVFPNKEMLEQLEYLKANPNLIDEDKVQSKIKEGMSLVEIGTLYQIEIDKAQWNIHSRIQLEKNKMQGGATTYPIQPKEDYICASDPYTTDSKGSLFVYKKDEYGNIMDVTYGKMSSTQPVEDVFEKEGRFEKAFTLFNKILIVLILAFVIWLAWIL